LKSRAFQDPLHSAVRLTYPWFIWPQNSFPFEGIAFCRKIVAPPERSWLIFYVAHSLRIDSDMLVVRALKISQLTDGGMPPTYDSMH
jgi:hypothetical protein